MRWDRPPPLSFYPRRVCSSEASPTARPPVPNGIGDDADRLHQYWTWTGLHPNKCTHASSRKGYRFRTNGVPTYTTPILSPAGGGA